MISILRQLAAAAKGHMFAPETFTGNNPSYRIGKIIFRLRDNSKSFRRGIRRWLRSPLLARRRASLFRYIQNKDWLNARSEAHTLANLAENARDARLMEEIGKIFFALREYERSSALRLASRRLRRRKNSKEWQGENVDGLIVVDFVENDNQGLGSTLQRGFLLGALASRAGKIAAIVQPRLQSLFARSFPGIEVFSSNADEARIVLKEADKIAGAEHLDFYIGRSAENIAALFKPLKPDAAAISTFQRTYRSEGKPLVGISWGSSAYAKEVPKLQDWIALLKRTDAQFVSLQYGKVEPEIDELENESGKSIIADPTVDQLKDMDRFAAQISALDAVVTISNTGSHLAGALGVPTVVLNDDNFRRVWPVDSDQIPYYPALVLATQKGRLWSAVMDEVGLKLRKMLSKHDPYRGEK